MHNGIYYSWHDLIRIRNAKKKSNTSTNFTQYLQLNKLKGKHRK